MTQKDKYIPGSSHLVDYAIERLGAVIIDGDDDVCPESGEVIRGETTRPPFPCLTGASNTSTSYEIDQNMYPGVVAAGVDTLHLNFGIAGYKESERFEILEQAKLQVASAGYKANRGMPVEWFGQEFMLQARGSKGGYEYLLMNGDLELQIMPNARGGTPSPELRAIFRSPFLWRLGDVAAYDKVIEYLNTWAFIDYCKVSRADLCVDMVMPLPTIDRKKQVVSRIREKDLFYGGDFQRGQRHTGYQFGRSGLAVARLYDKAYEISVKGHGHVIPHWQANGWDGETPVSRFELEMKRQGLRKFDLNMNFTKFQDCKADIWSYGTGKFLRIVKPGSATRKERAQVTDYWRQYQSCSPLFGNRLGILPINQAITDWQSLVKQATGCLTSAWSRLAAEIGESQATLMLIQEWGEKIPIAIIKDGLIRKSKYVKMNCS